MSRGKRHPVPADWLAEIDQRATDEGMSRADWIRRALRLWSDARRRPLAQGYRDVWVRHSAGDLERHRAAAERAGVPLERWYRLAIGAELGRVSPRRSK